MAGYDMCIGSGNLKLVCTNSMSAPAISPGLFLDSIYAMYNVQRNIHYFPIIDFYSNSELEGFENFFALAFEFLDKNGISTHRFPMFEAVATAQNQHCAVANNNYFSMVQLLRKKPNMYLMGATISRLEAFLAGYFACAKSHNIQLNPHPGFEAFVQKQCGVASHKNIFRTIEFMFIEESAAFQGYFSLLDRYSAMQH